MLLDNEKNRITEIIKYIRQSYYYFLYQTKRHNNNFEKNEYAWYLDPYRKKVYRVIVVDRHYNDDILEFYSVVRLRRFSKKVKFFNKKKVVEKSTLFKTKKEAILSNHLLKALGIIMVDMCDNQKTLNVDSETVELNRLDLFNEIFVENMQKRLKEKHNLGYTGWDDPEYREILFEKLMRNIARANQRSEKWIDIANLVFFLWHIDSKKSRSQ